MPNNLDEVVQGRLRWFGHVRKMTIDRIPHNALHALFEGKRNRADNITINLILIVNFFKLTIN